MFNLGQNVLHIYLPALSVKVTVHWKYMLRAAGQAGRMALLASHQSHPIFQASYFCSRGQSCPCNLRFIATGRIYGAALRRDVGYFHAYLHCLSEHRDQAILPRSITMAILIFLSLIATSLYCSRQTNGCFCLPSWI